MSDKELKQVEVKVENNKVKKPNAWIQHVKNVAEKDNLTYREALKVAKESYKK